MPYVDFNEQELDVAREMKNQINPNGNIRVKYRDGKFSTGYKLRDGRKCKFWSSDDRNVAAYQQAQQRYRQTLMHDLCHRDIRKYYCRDGTVTVFTKRGNVSTLVSSALAAQLAGFIVDTEPSAARIQHIANRLTPAE
ncbi:hypothetical protein ACJMK2_027183 [Sinanodonta woodiana]|uniref:Uncharacterized protein n=1 Tax=Sinanodonta woodiana TaxID=1069815 RepID=A0ABD3XNQ1_SINWO